MVKYMGRYRKYTCNTDACWQNRQVNAVGNTVMGITYSFSYDGSYAIFFCVCG
jgi:predicted DNA-binding helix-hairpin-helix protein